jgi:hypothetical protein
MTEIDPASIREAVEAIRLSTPVYDGADGAVLERAPDFDRMTELLGPLVETHGLDAVLEALRPHKDDQVLADALFFVCWMNDHNMLTVFSEDEIVDAARQQLLASAEGTVTDTRGLPHWGWHALFQHYYWGDDHPTDEQAFAILLKLIELLPLDDSILWMIGDGPIAHACGHSTEYRRRFEKLAQTEPKIARAIELAEED